MGWFSRRRNPDVIDDVQVAEMMRNLAEKFISGSAAEGWHFNWDCAEVSRLDEGCDAFVGTSPPPEIRHSMIMAMGAYLGELMVRCGGGHWSYDTQERAAVVVMPNGLKAYPHNKVAKRIERGPEHSLFEFYRYSLTRELTPDSKLTPMPGAAPAPRD